MKKCIFALILLLSSCSIEKPASSKHSCTIAMEEEPTTFDPRLIRSTCSVNIAHLIGEGLFRFDEKGTLVPALAEKVDIDETGTLYTFTLRDAKWSNGDTIAASDFEKTILSLMDPATISPHANQLYMIKGVKALDEKHLTIELKTPTSYFLTLTATHFLYPVHSQDLLGSGKLPIASGPFVLDSHRSGEVVLKKNAHFWSEVKLDEIRLLPLNDQLAMQMFEVKEVDWVGSPIGRLPPDSVPKLLEKGALHVQDALGTFWLRTNTLDPSLCSLAFRKALSRSINRDEIVTHITQGGQKPAESIVPPVLYGEDVGCLGTSFEKSASEKPITLTYIYNERNHKIAQYLEQKWKETLGLQLILEATESKTFYERIAKGEFQLSIGSWFADIPDPVNFLEVFKSKDLKTNGTGWENAEYRDLLDLAGKETDSLKRAGLLKRGEQILMDACPVIPLYFAVFNWVSNPDLKGVFVSPLGFFDFRMATKDDR